VHPATPNLRDDGAVADEPQPSMPDLGGLLGMAMDLQQQVAEAQEKAAAEVVEGQAGGGAVRIAVTGGFEFQSVVIDPEALDPDDVEMLQDLVLAALHDATAKVAELVAGANPLAAMGGMDLAGLGDLGGLGSLDLGGLAGALGVAEAEPADGDAGPAGEDRPANPPA
jgi:DNA-binding YbaB/EbfC family protein